MNKELLEMKEEALLNIGLNKLLEIEGKLDSIGAYISYISKNDHNIFCSTIKKVVESNNVQKLMENLKYIYFSGLEDMLYLYFSIRKSHPNELKELTQMIKEEIKRDGEASYEVYDAFYLFCILNDLDYNMYENNVKDSCCSSDYELLFRRTESKNIYSKIEKYSREKIAININIEDIYKEVSENQKIVEYISSRSISSTGMILKEKNEQEVKKLIKAKLAPEEVLKLGILGNLLIKPSIEAQLIVRDKEYRIITKKDAEYTHFLFELINKEETPEIELKVEIREEDEAFDIFLIKLSKEEKFKLIEAVYSRRIMLEDEVQRYLMLYVLNNVKDYSELKEFEKIKDFLFGVYFKQINYYEQVKKEMFIREFKFDLIIKILPLLNSELKKDLINYYLVDLSLREQTDKVEALYNLNPKNFKRNLNKVVKESFLFKIALKKNESYFYQMYENYSQTNFFDKECVKEVLIKYAVKNGTKSLINYFNVYKSIIDNKEFQKSLEKNSLKILEMTKNKLIVKYLKKRNIISNEEYMEILLERCSQEKYMSKQLEKGLNKDIEELENKKEFLERLPENQMLAVLFFYYMKKEKGFEFITEEYFQEKLIKYKKFMLLDKSLLSYLMNGKNNDLLNSMVKKEESVEIIDLIIKYSELNKVKIEEPVKEDFYYIYNKKLEDIFEV